MMLWHLAQVHSLRLPRLANNWPGGRLRYSQRTCTVGNSNPTGAEKETIKHLLLLCPPTGDCSFEIARQHQLQSQFVLRVGQAKPHAGFDIHELAVAIDDCV